MIEITQDDMVYMMMEKIGVRYVGTYNNADPTHMEKGSIDIHLEYGFTCEQDGCPISETVKASFIDCTWGVDFKFETSMGTLKGYWSRDGENSEWIIREGTDAKKFFDVFRVLLLSPAEGEVSNQDMRNRLAEMRRYE